MRGRHAPYLDPKLLIEGTGDHTALKEDHHSLMSPVLNLKVQVLLPVLQLSFLQRFNVKIRSFYLQWRRTKGTESKPVLQWRQNNFHLPLNPAKHVRNWNLLLSKRRPAQNQHIHIQVNVEERGGSHYSPYIFPNL